ncbi:NADPH-dependent ferric siderophore reductase, contains FAD-binding and SIP domains [Devosia enhydra]|uniref:NADPH-dependent ferric siderophore reductase, contains FAD-binding and SIP domains n=1 Tax=Devosia enhydra TaxID=665118 RepID=A0A1K2HZA2_9HYPH|nr:siderophore-interacting protein [Devosia enhydra]SFZ85311.1 NADPH-dependent ferric siderophore reductase, contains FAD-binding and SIP domains [Devosia enhydra]
MDRTLQRLRHDTRIRILEVVGVHDITPRMRRITLSGADLAGFSSPGHADHVKVFFPEPGKAPVLPELGPNGLQFPAGQPRPQMRDYTPRLHDPVANTLAIDFVLHGDGPAASWAANAAIGQKLVIGGPRGSLIVPFAFDWYFLAGDEAGLPAIARRLEELPQGAKAVAVIEVADAGEEQPIATRADLALIWVHRNGAPAGTGTHLLDAVAALGALPQGDAYGFIAGEANAARALRAHLVEVRGFNPEWVKAAGYWLLGVADAHEPH